jgi:hypothetical protein
MNCIFYDWQAWSRLANIVTWGLVSGRVCDTQRFDRNVFGASGLDIGGLVF